MALKQLSSEKRRYIEIELKNRASQNKIAEKPGPSQILSRQFVRNLGLRGDRHHQAHNIDQSRHREKNKAIKLTEVIKRQIFDDSPSNSSPERGCNKSVPCMLSSCRGVVQDPSHREVNAHRDDYPCRMDCVQSLYSALGQAAHILRVKVPLRKENQLHRIASLALLAVTKVTKRRQRNIRAEIKW